MTAVLKILNNEHEEHVCCNLEKLQSLEQHNKKLLETLRQISEYTSSLDSQDKRAINNIIIHNL